ncbi:type II secretion system F family protein [Actimicrobium antarcticum]|uniref:Type II secretion system protein GspF domain-containing protein n=1 Tax=Actimicrobium antarcticum TaxID=1051899 RepID=A0ABP7SPA3_9BURK
MSASSSDLIILLLALGVGLATALIGWLLSRSVADVPPENRDYKDPPPIGFRLIWWPIQWVSHFLERHPLRDIEKGSETRNDKRNEQRLLRLRRAGLDYMISPAQFTAARLLSAGFLGLVCYWVLGSFAQMRADQAPFGIYAYAQMVLVGMLIGWVMPLIWLHDRIAQRKRELLKSLPFYLDIITLCVEAGLNMQGALNQAVDKGPPGVFHDECQRVLRDIRAGKGRADALRAMAERMREPGITSFIASVIQAESMGMNLGPVLRAQADQRRTERFLRAEKKALEAPVKLLLPLIAFIFPCTFIVLFFPIVMQFLHAGL